VKNAEQVMNQLLNACVLRLRLYVTFTILILLFTIQCSTGQPGAVDSLTELLKRETDQKRRSELSVELSRAYMKNDFSKSLEYAQNAVSFAEKSKDREQIALAVKHAGGVCFFLGLFDLSASYLTRHLELMKAAGNEQESANAYANLGLVRIAIGDYDKAESMLLKWQMLMDTLTEQRGIKVPASDLISIEGNFGVLYLQKGDLEKASLHYRQGLAISSLHPECPAEKAKILNGFGELMIMVRKPDSAILFLDEAREIQEKLNDQPGLAMALSSIGKAYALKGNADTALSYFQDAYRISTEVGSITARLLIAENLATFFQEKNRHDSALKYLRMAEELRLRSNSSKAQEKLTQEELLAGFREREIARDKSERSWRILLLLFSISCFVLALTLTYYSYRTNRKYQMTELARMELEVEARKNGLEMELLRNEIELKDRQLATDVMASIRKNEIIGNLVKKIQVEQQKDKSGDGELSGKIISELEKTKEAGIWEDFEVRFNQVYHSFHENLHALNPSLTTNERRLCAFLKLDMNTKEIATITGQSVRAVELARIRLRKKLGLTHSESSLYDTLSRL
jgi:tetratricopeptide (TPR) repeat protein